MEISSRAELFAERPPLAQLLQLRYGGVAERAGGEEGGEEGKAPVRGCRTLRGPIGYLRLINTAR